MMVIEWEDDEGNPIYRLNDLIDRWTAYRQQVDADLGQLVEELTALRDDLEASADAQT